MKLAYLAYKFSSDPIGNTVTACIIANKIMEKHPDIFVIVPHYAVDGVLDGIISYSYNDKVNKWVTRNFSKERRIKGGLYSLALIEKVDMFILGCDPTYDSSAGVTWELVFVHFLNLSREKQIEIKTVEELLNEKC